MDVLCEHLMKILSFDLLSYETEFNLGSMWMKISVYHHIFYIIVMKMEK